MSWSHSSKLGLVAVAVLVLVATVGVASAVSVTQEDAPEEAEVGDSVTITVELGELFTSESAWQLNGQTELQNAQWTIELYQGDTLLNTHESSGDQPDPVTLEESSTDADRVVVKISGTTPEVSSYSYEEPATFKGGEIVQVIGNGEEVNYLSEHQVHHFTSADPGSKEARTALNDADAAIQSASDDGADVSDAESSFDEAVTAYDNAEFTNAVSLAEEAQSQAESSGSGGSDGGSSTDDGSSTDGSSDGTSGDGSTDGTSADGADSGGNTSQNGDDSGNASSDGGSDDSDDGGLLWPILYGVFGLLILGGILGGVYWYQQQSQGPNRDPLG
ncbi:DUF4398 domain-containing protein [Salinarchaeum laminariae]|uniref:DUF4398 domain-containing protein n=1 Tax=Salinarchaeum laminariae TaxID=869888 RepID=UPI0020C07786|nr:DUF4398 domain-containing protein [Salinarchaeum laminariae]